MAALSPRNSNFLSASLYAGEAKRGAAGGQFSPELEAEFVQAQLASNRALIRIACTLATLLAAFRAVELALAGAWSRPQLFGLGLVLITSVALAVLAWSPWFGSRYLPVARFAVPIRNAIAAVFVARAAANGQPELLMALPLMVLGPFFFLGLRYRVALVTVGLTVACFLAAAALFGSALPLLIRSIAFLLLGAVAAAVAARHFETWSRKSFLESRVIAELAERDALTGLKNRGVFDEHLHDLWARAVDAARAIAILMIDVDDFKAYNDAYGHQAGDLALRRVAQTLQSFVSRPLDVLARYGGEEFAVILYDVDCNRAQAVAERMRAAVKRLAIEHNASRAGSAVTISVGVAVVEPSRERQSRGALQLADHALYEAKMRGRNRTVVMDQDAHRLIETGVFSQGAHARPVAAIGRR